MTSDFRLPLALDRDVSVGDETLVVVDGSSDRPGARPKRAWNRRELLRLERSRRKTDSLLLAFSAWMADRHPRPLRTITRRQYVRTVRRAFEIANGGGYSLLTADLRTIRFILGSIAPHPTTQNGMISALRAFFEFLKAQGMIKSNPANEIGRPPPIKTLPRPLKLDDVLLYLDAAAGLSIDHKAVAYFGVYMGLRCSEIRYLSWPDFFEADGRLWCDVDGKGGKRRRMFVHPEVRALLPALRDEHRHPRWLFPSTHPARPDMPVGHQWPGKRHRQSVAEAGIPPATLHALRHSFATYLRKTGVDIAVVKLALGHANLSSTEIYAEVLPDELAAAMENLHFDVGSVAGMREQREIEGAAVADGKEAGDAGGDSAGTAS